MRLEPPPIPKQDIIFWTSPDPHSAQTTFLFACGDEALEPFAALLTREFI